MSNRRNLMSLTVTLADTIRDIMHRIKARKYHRSIVFKPNHQARFYIWLNSVLRMPRINSKHELLCCHLIHVCVCLSCTSFTRIETVKLNAFEPALSLRNVVSGFRCSSFWIIADQVFKLQASSVMQLAVISTIYCKTYNLQALMRYEDLELVDGIEASSYYLCSSKT